MRLAIDPRGGTVRLTLPRRASLAEAYRWVETKRRWIERQLAALPPATPIEPGLVFYCAGREVTIDWSPSHARAPRLFDSTLQIGGPRELLPKRVLAWLRLEAKSLLERETRVLADRIGVDFISVSVGDPVSRWGSCSASGRIRYSWRLILAPNFVRRATVAHEVAHLVHLNHGAAFHSLARQLLRDDPGLAKNWLRTNGAALHWFGRER